MPPKFRKIAAAGLILTLVVGGVLLRPDAGSAALSLAREVSARTGLSARPAGTARYAWALPLRLEIPALDITGLGRLEDVVLVGNALDARANFLGRAGSFAMRDGAIRFDADGVSARLDPGDGRLRIDAKFAGRDLHLAGRPGAGGFAGLEIGWDANVANGQASYSADRTALEVEAKGPGLELSGRALLAEGAFEGVLVLAQPDGGILRAEFRAGGDVFDVAKFDLRAPDFAATGSLRREAQRMSIDARIDEIGLAPLAALAVRRLGDAAGDVDLRLRIGRLGWAQGEALGVILVAAREAGRIVVDELAIRSLAEASLRIRAGMLDLQAPDARRFLAALGAPVDRHLGALSLRGPVAVDAGAPGLRIAPLELSLAGQSATGEGVWQGGRLALSLAGGRLVLDPFFGRPLAAPAVRGPLLTRSQTARAAAAAAPPAPGPGGWSRVPIRLDLAGAMPLDLRLAARELVLGDLALGDARIAALYDSAGLDLSELSGSLLGGALSASGRIDAQAPRFDLKFELAHAEWAQVLGMAGAPPTLRGPVTLDGRLAASGGSASALMVGLAGTLRLESPGGTLDGLDLAGLFAYAAAARGPDLVELGRRFARGGRSPFAAASGTWRIERGRASSADTRLTASGGAIEISGSVDLANWTLDIAAALAANGAQLVPRIAMAGPPDRAKVTLSAGPARGAEQPAGSGGSPRAPAVRR
ncbi:MAG: AsmA-like C-terminal region-containing protein [Proteobacteria bacterium]|nr:AsmA-like C-terminal region-containing protein [Pseudomonadota bacterium]